MSHEARVPRNRVNVKPDFRYIVGNALCWVNPVAIRRAPVSVRSNRFLSVRLGQRFGNGLRQVIIREGL